MTSCFVAGDDEADGDVAVVGGVGGVEGAGAVVEADFAADFCAELGGEFGRRGKVSCARAWELGSTTKGEDDIQALYGWMVAD